MPTSIVALGVGERAFLASFFVYNKKNPMSWVKPKPVTGCTLLQCVAKQLYVCDNEGVEVLEAAVRLAGCFARCAFCNWAVRLSREDRTLLGRCGSTFVFGRVVSIVFVPALQTGDTLWRVDIEGDMLSAATLLTSRNKPSISRSGKCSTAPERVDGMIMASRPGAVYTASTKVRVACVNGAGYQVLGWITRCSAACVGSATGKQMAPQVHNASGCPVRARHAL